MDDEALAVDKLPDEAPETPAEETPEEADEGEPEEGGKPEADPAGEEDKPEDKPRRKPSRTQRKIASLQAQLEEMRGLVASREAPKAEDAIQPPKPDDFPDYDAYQRALIRHEAKQIVAEERKASEEARVKANREAQSRTMAQKRDALYEAGSSKFEDFEEVFDNTVPVSPAMAEALLESDVGHEVAYYLGTNTEEAARIARLNPIAAAREIGRIEAKITASIPKKPTGAPKPVSTVGASARGSRDPSKMGFEEYKAARMTGKIK